MIYNMLLNLNLLSALFGFIGTILIFFYGLPSKINKDGHVNLVLEQEDEDAKKKSRRYIFLSYLGLSLIAISFLIQIINTVFNL